MKCIDTRSPYCLWEYTSKLTFQHNFVCISPFMATRKSTVRHAFCVFASVSALRKPDRIEFSLASSDLCICLLFSYFHILTFLNVLCTCSKCMLAYVLLLHMFASNLLYRRFVLNESLPTSSLPNIFVSFLLIHENVHRFTSSFFFIQKEFSFICRQ